MKEKKQKCFLCDNVKNLHKHFLIENPATEISYSLFCRMKPFSVVTPTNTDRETCLCKVHENIKFLVEKLRHHKVIDSTNLESIVEATCCSIEKKNACMEIVMPLKIRRSKQWLIMTLRLWCHTHSGQLKW